MLEVILGVVVGVLVGWHVQKPALVAVVVDKVKSMMGMGK